MTNQQNQEDTMTTKTKRTITLTDRPPIRITEEDWPVIAKATWYQGEIERQANRRGWMKIRQHSDGRTIVYGGFTTQWQGESDRRGGELLGGEAHGQGEAMEPRYTVDAIRRVAEDLFVPEDAVRDLIADLPAEEILVTPELARAIARAIEGSAGAVLRERGFDSRAIPALAREIGNNAAQTVVLVIDEHRRAVTAATSPCWRCGFGCGTDGVNDQCRPCHDREIRREKDEERAR